MRYFLLTAKCWRRGNFIHLDKMFDVTKLVEAETLMQAESKLAAYIYENWAHGAYLERIESQTLESL